MKRIILTLLILGAAWHAQAQMVFLKVSPEGSKQDDKTTIENGAGKSFTRKNHLFRQETIEISIRNTYNDSFDYVVEWLFLASPAKGGGDPEPYHAEEKTITLAKDGNETFQVTSPKMESIQKYYHTFESHKNATGGREEREKTRYLGMEGVKPAGYVVRVRANRKVIAIEASDAQLKRRYQNPAAPWNPPAKPEPVPEKAPPKKKPTGK